MLLWPLQSELLARITDAEVDHVVHLVSRGVTKVDNVSYCALVLRPVGEPLDVHAATSLVAQVTHALDTCFMFMFMTKPSLSHNPLTPACYSCAWATCVVAHSAAGVACCKRVC